MIQRSFKRRGIERMYRSSGASNPAQLKRINKMLTELAERGDPDSTSILLQLNRGEKTFLDVLAAFDKSGAEGISKLANDASIDGNAFERWLAHHDVRESTKVSYRANYAAMMRFKRRSSQMSGLPAILEDYQRDCVKQDRNHRAWALALNVSKGWVGKVLGDTSPTYLRLRQLKPNRQNRHRSRARPYFTPRHVHDVMQRLPAEVAAMLWTMATSGMGPKEYLEDGCEIAEGALHIRGKKTEHRDRRVPLITPPAPLAFRDYKTLYRLIQRASNGAMCPYDLRRAYPRWLLQANVSPNRVQMYQGHAEQNQTDTYAYHDTRTFLSSDGVLLRDWIEQQLAAEPPSTDTTPVVWIQRQSRATKQRSGKRAK